jgi:hypothetical protein
MSTTVRQSLWRWIMNLDQTTYLEMAIVSLLMIGREQTPTKSTLWEIETMIARSLSAMTDHTPIGSHTGLHTVRPLHRQQMTAALSLVTLAMLMSLDICLLGESIVLGTGR